MRTLVIAMVALGAFSLGAEAQMAKASSRRRSRILGDYLHR